MKLMSLLFHVCKRRVILVHVDQASVMLHRFVPEGKQKSQHDSALCLGGLPCACIIRQCYNLSEMHFMLLLASHNGNYPASLFIQCSLHFLFCQCLI